MRETYPLSNCWTSMGFPQTWVIFLLLTKITSSRENLTNNIKDILFVTCLASDMTIRGNTFRNREFIVFLKFLLQNIFRKSVDNDN